MMTAGLRQEESSIISFRIDPQTEKKPLPRERLLLRLFADEILQHLPAGAAADAAHEPRPFSSDRRPCAFRSRPACVWSIRRKI